MSNIEETLEAFRGPHHGVRYLHMKNNKLKSKPGVLTDIRTTNQVAYFQNNSLFSCLQTDIKVKLDQVVLPLNHPYWDAETSAAPALPQSPDANLGSICNFETGDEVVFAEIEEIERQCRGKITLLGKMLVEGKFEIIALVETLQAELTNDTPRNLSHPYKRLKEKHEILKINIKYLEKSPKSQVAHSTLQSQNTWEASSVPKRQSAVTPSNIDLFSTKQNHEVHTFSLKQQPELEQVEFPGSQLSSNSLESCQQGIAIKSPGKSLHVPPQKSLADSPQTGIYCGFLQNHEIDFTSQCLKTSTLDFCKNSKITQISENLESEDSNLHENMQQPQAIQNPELGPQKLKELQDKEQSKPSKTIREGSGSAYQTEVVLSLKDDTTNNNEEETLTKIKRTRSSSQTNVFEDIQCGENSKVSAIKRKRDWKQRIDVAHFLTLVGTQTDVHRSYGIQGYNNSCYIDSSIFTLFSFSHGLDSFINRSTDETDEGKIKKILRNKIIKPLRTEYFVPSANISKLRNVLAEKVNTEYIKAYMDVEEFLLDLFNLIGTPELFEYDTGTGDYIHQIMLPLTWNSKSKRVHLMCVQRLLEDSFESLEVKLTKIPDRPFIIKLPVSEGILIPCKGVVPNLTLDLDKITVTSKIPAKKSNITMKLSAVICLRRSHFVAFVRTGQVDKSEWIFMDSNPINSKPECHIMTNINKCIKNALECLKTHGCKSMEEPSIGQFRLFRDAYICVYV